MMGAPTVMVEKLPRGDEVLHAFETLQAHLGRKAVATVPMEIGGINSMIPISLAAQAHVPLIDADFMGRAFPELQMVLPGVFGRTARRWPSPTTRATPRRSRPLTTSGPSAWPAR